MRRGLVGAFLVVGLLLSACDDASEADPRAACAEPPEQAVRDSTVALTAEDGYESGTLPPLVDKPGVVYLCRWRAADTSRVAVQIDIEWLDDYRIGLEEDGFEDTDGDSLASEIEGQGEAWSDTYDGRSISRAQWLCGHRLLSIVLYRPGSEDDRVALAKELAETLIPQVGCGGPLDPGRDT